MAFQFDGRAIRYGAPPHMMHVAAQERLTAAVFILSSNHLLRLGLQQILENEGWIRLIGFAANAIALDNQLKHACLDIVILDSEMAHDLTALIQKIKTVDSRIRIVLLCELQEERARQAIDLGIDSIVLKAQPSGVLIAMIDHLTQSGDHRPPRLENGVTGATSVRPLNTLLPPPGPTSESKRLDGLTERECQIIRCVSQGLSNKDIADRLCISSITVRHHLTAIFDKLGVPNRKKLIVHAHERGLVDLTAQARR